MKKIISRFLWLLSVVFIYWALITLITEEHNNPPELARITNLSVEYYSMDSGWINSTAIPSSARRLRTCGTMEKSEMATLQIRISEPDDKNVFITQDEYFFDVHPGEFCSYVYLMYGATPGNYTLWLLDARRTAAELDLEFIDK
jgi:hypothetical protein